MKKYSTVFTGLLVVLVATSIWNLIIGLRKQTSPIRVSEGRGFLSQSYLRSGMAKCDAIRARDAARVRVQQDSAHRTYNPRYRVQTKGQVGEPQPVLIKGGTVWDGQANVYEEMDVLLVNGVVARMERDIESRTEYKVYDASGRIVSPGIVDMHR
jgi:hypothetical protein